MCGGRCRNDTVEPSSLRLGSLSRQLIPLGKQGAGSFGVHGARQMDRIRPVGRVGEQIGGRRFEISVGIDQRPPRGDNFGIAKAENAGNGGRDEVGSFADLIHVILLPKVRDMILIVAALAHKVPGGRDDDYTTGAIFEYCVKDGRAV